MGFLLAFAGTFLRAAAGAVLALGADPMEGSPSAVVEVFGAAYLAGQLGLLLMGVATLRARALPLAIFAVTLL